MLQLLEGDIVHLPAPKNFSKRDIELTRDTPVFATADAPKKKADFQILGQFAME